MKAEQLLRAGKLTSAVEVLGAELRDNPTDRQRRTFLFELLCFAGEYERAGKHLDLLSEGSPEAVSGSLLYRAALHAEKTRQEMFTGGDLPKPEPEYASGAGVTIRLNGSEVTSLADADPRVGGRLELFAGGDYIWIPFKHLSSLSMEPPRRLRDLLWAPAKLTTAPDCEHTDLGEVLLPVLAPQSASHHDELVRLGRITEWCEDPSGAEVPFGQKTLLVDGEEVPILELRELEISRGETAQ